MGGECFQRLPFLQIRRSGKEVSEPGERISMKQKVSAGTGQEIVSRTFPLPKGFTLTRIRAVRGDDGEHRRFYSSMLMRSNQFWLD